jgi:hypothetical protein
MNLIRSSSTVVLPAPTDDDRTPSTSMPAASSATLHQPPPSPSANDSVTQGSKKRRREETKEEEVKVNESSATSVEQSQQLQPLALEGMKSDPVAAADTSLSADTMVDAAAAGILHIDKRARIEYDPLQQAQSLDQSPISVACHDTPPVTTTASGAQAASTSIPSLASTLCPAPLMSDQIEACIQEAGFDVSHNDAAPSVRKLLSQLITCAWNHVGLEPQRRDEVPLIRSLIHRIDVSLEQMARRQSSPYPAKVRSLVSYQQQSSLHDTVRFILKSVNLNRLELVSQDTRDRRIV